jgi:hypothetical protein
MLIHMGNLVDQLPTLIGVVVGSLGTVLATTFSDRARWRHDRDVRWEERRLEAYSRYAETLKEIHALSFRMTSPTNPMDPQNAATSLARAEQARTKAWEAVLLVGESNTVVAARQWREAIRQVSQLAQSEGRRDPNWVSLVHQANEARDRFYAVARRGLSLRGGEVAQADWLSRPPPGRDR